MAENNGDYARIVHDLVEAARLNLDEHEKIWRSIDKLRESQLTFIQQNERLIAAIRDLIDRIPPESLR